MEMPENHPIRHQADEFSLGCISALIHVVHTMFHRTDVIESKDGTDVTSGNSLFVRRNSQHRIAFARDIGGKGAV